MNTILEAKNLGIGYDNQLIDSINFKINKGELIGIIGKNGIGKSTLLKTLMKMIPVKNGQIFINNESLKEFNNQDLSKNIAVVLTEKIPKSQYSVYELLSLGRFPHSNWLFQLNDKDHEIIDLVIKQLDLEAVVNQKVHELSDGMLQKVMIGKALVQDTPIIILDEPTTYLDLENTFQIFEILKKIALEQNKTILFSTHQIEIALQICNQLIIFSNQKVIVENSNQIIKNKILEHIFDTNKVKFNSISKKFDYNF